MDLLREAQMRFSVSTVTDQVAYVFGDVWYPREFTPSWSFNLDGRNFQVGSGSVISVIPSIQFASVRTEHPDDAQIISGTAATSVGFNPYNVTPASISTKGWWRPGIGYWLSTVPVAGVPFGRAEGTLYTAWRPMGLTMPPEQVIVNPTNDNTEWSIFPLNRGRAIPTRGLDKLGAMVVGQGNVNGDMAYWLWLRAFNDPRARGDWTIAQGTVATPSSGNFELNLGEVIPPAGITLSNFQWCEAALGVRHVNGGAPTRCIFDIIPLLKYS